MIFLLLTTDKIDCVTSSAATLDVHVSAIDAAASGLTSPAAVKQNTAISSATTTDILAAPASSTTRTVKQLNVRNKDASLSCDVTIRFNANGTAYELFKATLSPGQVLSYIEGVGFFQYSIPSIRSGLKNSSTSDQSPTAGSANYLTGSAITLPTSSTGLVAGVILRWHISLGKTGAGTGTSAFAIYFGTNGTTADTSRCATGNLDTETAAADEMEAFISATIRGPIGASCIVQSIFSLNNNLTTTGFSNTARKAQVKAVQSAAFDITPAGTIAGIVLTPGASDVITVRQVSAELLMVGQ